MNLDDEEDIPILLDTAVSLDHVESSGSDIDKPDDDFRVPLTIVTGKAREAESCRSLN